MPLGNLCTDGEESTLEIMALQTDLCTSLHEGIDSVTIPNRRLLWTISYHHAANDGSLMALVAVIPIVAEELELTYAEVGLLGLGLIITVVTQLLVGRVADRMFSRMLLEIGAALMAATFVLVLFVSDFVGLFLAVISMRVGASFYHPVGIAWITRAYKGKHRDTALGVQSGIGNLGVIASFASSGFLGEALGWKAPCFLWAGLNVLAVILGIAYVRGAEVLGQTAGSMGKVPPVRTMLKMSALVLPIASGGALYQVTSYFGPINLVSMHGWTAGTADLAFATWIGIGTLTSYYYGRLSSVIGRVALLRCGYAVSGLSAVSLFFASDWYVVVPILLAFGFTLFLTYPALFSMVTDRTQENERGTAFGILFGFQLGGGAVIVYVCGLLADILQDPAYAFVIIGVLSAASLAALAYGAPRSGGNS